NNRNPLLTSHPQQRRLQRIVNQIEHQLCVKVLGFKQLWCLDSSHPDRCRIDNNVELRLGDSILFDRLRARLARELLRRLGCAIENKNLRTLIAQTEYRSARRAASTKHQHLCSAQRHALFERTRDAGDVGIEAVELAVLRAQNSVAGSNLGRQRVSLLKVLHDLLLERHGDTETLDGDFINQLKQVGELV